MNFYHLIVFTSDPLFRAITLARKFLERSRIISTCMSSICFLVSYTGTYRSTKHRGKKSRIAARHKKKQTYLSFIFYVETSHAWIVWISRNAKGGRDLHVIGDGIRCGASIIKRAMNDEGLRVPRDGSRFIRRRRHLERRQGSSVKSPLIGLNVSGTVPSIEHTSGMWAEIYSGSRNQCEWTARVRVLDVYLERRKYLRMYVIILQLNWLSVTVTF